MALFIAFGNQKGGTGKSTCTVLTANTLSQPTFNYRLTVVDADPQQSITDARNFDLDDFDGVLPYDVLAYNVPTFLKRAAQLDKENDVILVDLPGKLDASDTTSKQEIAAVLNWLDVVFIPFTPGNFALEASLNFLRYLTEHYNPARTGGGYDPLRVVGFANMHRRRTKKSRYLVSEIDQVKAIADVPFMENRLHDYTAFREIDTLTSLYQPGNASDAAVRNFTRWLDELHQIVTNGKG
jgi:cellulose biosynthesis protein BcsQ